LAPFGLPTQKTGAATDCTLFTRLEMHDVLLAFR